MPNFVFYVRPRQLASIVALLPGSSRAPSGNCPWQRQVELVYDLLLLRLKLYLLKESETVKATPKTHFLASREILRGRVEHRAFTTAYTQDGLGCFTATYISGPASYGHKRLWASTTKPASSSMRMNTTGAGNKSMLVLKYL